MLTDVLEIPATTPGKVRRETATMPPGDLKALPAPGKWSVQLVLAHLEDVEEVGMHQRVEAMVTSDRPTLATFDQEARVHEMHYDRKDPRRTLASWGNSVVPMFAGCAGSSPPSSNAGACMRRSAKSPWKNW